MAEVDMQTLEDPNEPGPYARIHGRRHTGWDANTSQGQFTRECPGKHSNANID